MTLITQQLLEDRIREVLQTYELRAVLDGIQVFDEAIWITMSILL